MTIPSDCGSTAVSRPKVRRATILVSSGMKRRWERYESEQEAVARREADGHHRAYAHSLAQQSFHGGQARLSV